MGWFRGFFIILAGFLFWSCAGAERPVSLPIPFAGSFTSDSRVVIASGNPVGGNPALSLSLKVQVQAACTQFQNFNSNGSVAGITELCGSSTVTSTPFAGGRRDTFSLPAEVNFINSDRAAATVDCFDFPYSDPNVVVPPGSELRKGVCSAVIQEGDGSFDGSEDKETMTLRFVAVTHLENNRKVFDQMLEGSWVLNRLEGGAADGLGSDGQIISVMLVNGFSSNGAGETVSGPLFCEGQDPNDPGNACGSYEFTLLGGEFQDGQRFNAITNITVCEGDSCLPTTNALFVNDFIPELSENMIAAITDEVMETGMGMSLLTGGVANNAVVTQYDPIDCNNPRLTGKFREPGCAGRLRLDYRCLLLVNLETGDEFVFASSFIISETD